VRIVYFRYEGSGFGCDFGGTLFGSQVTVATSSGDGDVVGEADAVAGTAKASFSASRAAVDF